MHESRMVMIVETASIAPAAPSVWPIIDLLAVTGTDAARLAEDRLDRLELRLVALGRGRRMGVHVIDLVGRHAGLLDGAPRRPDRTDATRRRERDVRGVGRRAVADELRERLRAARLRVRELLEDHDAGTLTASRTRRGSTSNGRDAASGSSLRVDSARIAANPPTSVSKMPASEPPASITSASSRRIVSHASPIAWPPVAHAETVAKFGPVIPKLMATCPEPTFGIP